jgi:hypothetical protein
MIKSRGMKLAGQVARIWEKRNAYRLFVGKPEGNGPLGKPKRRWVNNVKMDHGQIGWVGVDWIGLAQNRNKWGDLVNSVMNIRECWEIVEWIHNWWLLE